MNQISATIKKDFLGLFRTFRFLLIVIIGLFTAILQPIMLKYMVPIMEMLKVPSDLLSALPEGNLPMAMASIFAELTDMGLLVILLCFMSFIGGEQKKKLLTIPITKGLTLESYVISKFIFFPVFGFLFGFIFSMTGYLISIALFGTGIPFVNIVLSSILVGIEILFTVVLATAIGILTSRPGIAVGCIYVLRTLLITILAAVNYNRFNPFALNTYASVFEYAELSEVLITLGITFILIAGLFIITYVKTQHRKLKY